MKPANRRHQPGPEVAEDAAENERWLTAGVGSVGAASFFSDSGHEITTSVLPTFLTSTLHTSAAGLGLIEGISDALQGVMKLIGGPLANDPSRRARLAGGGYLGMAAATGMIGLAGAVWQAGVLRAAAWLSRGLRTPARDSLLSSLAPPHAFGRAFGVERFGDNLGAVAGPLLAAGLVAWLGIRPAMYLAAVPTAFAAVAILAAAREARRRGLTGQGRTRARLHLRELRGAGVGRPLVPIALFELGNMATTMLILRATQLLHTGGRSAAAAASLAILIYAGHNVFASAVALAGGHWIDRAGPRVVFATGSALYVLAYAGFAVSWHSWVPLLISFALAGSGIGLAETAESALFAHLLPDSLRGSGFGLLGGVQAFGDFGSTALVGLLYAAVSPAVGFIYAAGLMAASLFASGGLRTPRREL